MKINKELFEQKFIKNENGCWIWTANKNKQGYGKIKAQGKDIFAHRASYILYKETNPEKLLVCHKCDNPSCVNPDHLFLGTHKDNHYDAQSKGRRPLTPHPSISYYAQGCRCEGCKLAQHNYGKEYERLHRKEQREKKKIWSKAKRLNDPLWRQKANEYKKNWRKKRKAIAEKI